MTGRRLMTGGAIDRERPLRFSFDGRSLQGLHGDTLASALLANGVAVVGRSFKLHRPRGLLAAGVEEPNALMQIGCGPGADPNPRATEIPLTDGLVARAVNAWPSASLDLLAVIDVFARFLPAGFYYKTFMWPKWSLFEPFIRRAAGLGRVSNVADLDRYETRFAHCDVLVVGAGPAGLAAALGAARSGARVIVCDQGPKFGGQLLWDFADIDGAPGEVWVRRAAEALAAHAEVTLLTHTTAAGYFDHNAVALIERVQERDAAMGAPAGSAPRQRLWQVRARHVVLATGALERPLVFPGNDRPGVMLSSAVREYIGRYSVIAGEEAVVFTNNDGGYLAAQALYQAGGRVAAVVDSRADPPASVRAMAQDAEAALIPGGRVTGTRGAPALAAVRVCDASGQDRWIKADLLAMSGGLNPTIHLHRQSGGRLDWDPGAVFFKPGPPAQASTSVGSASGVLGLKAALEGGAAAGAAAAIASGFADDGTAPPRATSAPRSYAVEALWRVNAPGKAFVDFQNDVSADDIALSARENFVSVEHLKRYTTLGMAPDQGKTSNVNALAIMADLTGRSIEETGSTLYRFPFTPLPFGALAERRRGALFRPLRRLPAHKAHVAAGAVFEDYSGALRPAFYPKAGETPHAAEQREALCVRRDVGVFDASPLGKIEVVGKDAALFLDRIYANTMSTLKVGAARYGLMLNELGVIIDDGVTVRLAEDRFLVGATSSGAARIASWLDEWLQCEWPDLEVLIAPMTSSIGVITLTGPSARLLLSAVGVDVDISSQALPHMTWVEGRAADVPVRICRVSFTGEISFEINAPASASEKLWSLFLHRGQDFGAAPVGIDAWMLLRTEKGFIHVGADTDGGTVPDDIGWGHVLRRKSDFVGRRSLTRPDCLRSDRHQLVGLELREALPAPRFAPVGAHVVRGGASGESEGYVTSSGFSPILGRGVALAMVKGGRGRLGEEMTLITPEGPLPVRLAAHGAYDPSGSRLKG